MILKQQCTASLVGAFLFLSACEQKTVPRRESITERPVAPELLLEQRVPTLTDSLPPVLWDVPGDRVYLQYLEFPYSANMWSLFYYEPIRLGKDYGKCWTDTMAILK